MWIWLLFPFYGLWGIGISNDCVRLILILHLLGIFNLSFQNIRYCFPFRYIICPCVPPEHHPELAEISSTSLWAPAHRIHHSPSHTRCCVFGPYCLSSFLPFCTLTLISTFKFLRGKHPQREILWRFCPGNDLYQHLSTLEEIPFCSTFAICR